MARRTASQRLADLLLRAAGDIAEGEVLEDFIVRRRSEGVSFRHIAKELDRAHDLDIAEVTLRGWVADYVPASVEPVTAAGGVR